jgi:hypothetical protein
VHANRNCAPYHLSDRLLCLRALPFNLATARLRIFILPLSDSKLSPSRSIHFQLLFVFPIHNPIPGSRLWIWDVPALKPPDTFSLLLRSSPFPVTNLSFCFFPQLPASVKLCF